MEVYVWECINACKLSFWALIYGQYSEISVLGASLHPLCLSLEI